MKQPGKEYDYVIVGSGSGGGVVASRLSEDPGTSVLVLEAGGTDWNFVFHMGIGFYRNRPAGLNWRYTSEPEAHLDNRPIDLPQGKLLGGSSSINGKIYSRGNPLDYDLWEQMGCEGWSYEGVLPYFKRAEGSWRGNNHYHGADGPLKTTAIDTTGVLQEPLIEAARSLGYRIVEDLDAPPFEGVTTRSDITVDARGRRSSIARCYLRPALQRDNLKIETRATVTRILIENSRAVGVEYVRGNVKTVVRARKEVVLSAGVYNTARLLLLSGIGPAQELRDVGIEPIVDLPGVGRNIADHASIMMGNLTRQPVTPLQELRIDRATVNFLRWALLGSGPFASQPLSAQALLKSDSSLDRPNVQIMFNPLRRDAQLWGPGIGARQEHRIEAGIILLHPYSRGSLKLRSANPNDPPCIRLNLMSDPRDLDNMIRAIRMTRAFYQTPAMAKLVKREAMPGEEVQTDSQMAAFIRQGLYTVRHPVGSCRMGQDEMCVVDPQLRVRGLQGLRIADASIMPVIPGGNTNAPTVMIGEKAADLIRGVHRNRHATIEHTSTAPKIPDEVTARSIVTIP